MDEFNVMVIGAGTMGVEIALTFSMAGKDVMLLDLPAPNGGLDLSRLAVARAIPKYVKDAARTACLKRIKCGNIVDHLCEAADYDWVFEAVPEELTLKVDILNKVSPYLKSTTLMMSNTSGISIAEIRSRLDASVRDRFFGTHFFNPASKNPLVELIPSGLAEQESIISVQAELTRMGKKCVISDDVPNFIVNRYLFFTLMGSIERAMELGLKIWEVDRCAGEKIGRPRTAIFGLLDLIGLDVWLAICKNMGAEVERYPKAIKLVHDLVQLGRLGRKSGECFYRYGESSIKNSQRPFLDLQTFTYITNVPELLSDERIIENFADSLAKMAAYSGDDPTRVFEKYLIESSIKAGEAVLPYAPAGRGAVDEAIQYGLGHTLGPFALKKLLNQRS